MSGLEGALCRGRWWLFDSTDVADHHAAAELCAECPAIEACRRWAHETSNAPGNASPAYRGLVGTWAGQLHGRQGAPRPELACDSEATC